MDYRAVSLKQEFIIGGYMAKIIDCLVEYMLAARQAQIAGGSDSKRQKPPARFAGGDRFGIDLEAGEARVATRARAGRQEECSVLGSNLKTTPIVAAFANGMSGHADETDDSNSQLHPGCAIVPAALAMAESQNSSGDALLRAVILGYDIGFRFHQAFEPRSTSFGATFGAPRRPARWRNWMPCSCAI